MAAQELETKPSSSSEPETIRDGESLVGRVVDKYEVIRRIGRGGMGSVYEGLDSRIRKRVALKFIDARLTQNVEAVARFQREAMAASAIESPHIVQIFDVGLTDDGIPYLVMELLRGRDLGKHVRSVGQLELGPALHVCSQVLKALATAHAAGIVHRDLKPDNVFLVEREGEVAIVKLLDFGVSKIYAREGVALQTLTREGAVVGTPHYMSPEQAQGLPDVDARTDLYSVGAILYECLTGVPPHDGQSYEQVIVRICTRDVPDVRDKAPEAPESIAQLLARALDRDREQRFQSAAEMQAALVEAAPEPIRDKFLSGSLSLGQLSLRPDAGTHGSGSRQRPLTPAEAAAVGSASTVAVTPIGKTSASSARDSGSRARTPTGTVSSAGVRPASPSGLDTAMPSTMTTPFAQSRRTGLTLLLVTVAVGVVVGILLAVGGLQVRIGDPTTAAPSSSPALATEAPTASAPASVAATATPSDSPTTSASSAASSADPPTTAKPVGPAVRPKEDLNNPWM